MRHDDGDDQREEGDEQQALDSQFVARAASASSVTRHEQQSHPQPLVQRPERQRQQQQYPHSYPQPQRQLPQQQPPSRRRTNNGSFAYPTGAGAPAAATSNQVAAAAVAVGGRQSAAISALPVTAFFTMTVRCNKMDTFIERENEVLKKTRQSKGTLQVLCLSEHGDCNPMKKNDKGDVGANNKSSSSSSSSSPILPRRKISPNGRRCHNNNEENSIVDDNNKKINIDNEEKKEDSTAALNNVVSCNNTAGHMSSSGMRMSVTPLPSSMINNNNKSNSDNSNNCQKRDKGRIRLVAHKSNATTTTTTAPKVLPSGIKNDELNGVLVSKMSLDDDDERAKLSTPSSSGKRKSDCDDETTEIEGARSYDKEREKKGATEVHNDDNTLRKSTSHVSSYAASTTSPIGSSNNNNNSTDFSESNNDASVNFLICGTFQSMRHFNATMNAPYSAPYLEYLLESHTIPSLPIFTMWHRVNDLYSRYDKKMKHHGKNCSSSSAGQSDPLCRNGMIVNSSVNGEERTNGNNQSNNGSSQLNNASSLGRERTSDNTFAAAHSTTNRPNENSLNTSDKKKKEPKKPSYFYVMRTNHIDCMKHRETIIELLCHLAEETLEQHNVRSQTATDSVAAAAEQQGCLSYDILVSNDVLDRYNEIVEWSTWTSRHAYSNHLQEKYAMRYRHTVNRMMSPSLMNSNNNKKRSSGSTTTSAITSSSALMPKSSSSPSSLSQPSIDSSCSTVSFWESNHLLPPS